MLDSQSLMMRVVRVTKRLRSNREMYCRIDEMEAISWGTSMAKKAVTTAASSI